MKQLRLTGSSLPVNDEGHDAPHVAAPTTQQHKCLNFKRLNATPQAADADGTRLHRALAASLARLGLAHSASDDEAILIAGRAYDMRQAIMMARQLGRFPA